MNARVHSSRQQAMGVSLFSFIDILTGLVGALSMIILGVSLSQIVPESPASSLLSTQIQMTERGIENKQAQIADLRRSIASAAVRETELQSERATLAALSHQVDQTVERSAQVAAALLEGQTARVRIARLEQERDRLRSEAARQNAEPQVEPDTIARDHIEVRFAGRGRNLKPVFVECARDGLVIHSARSVESIYWRNIAASDKFQTLMEQLKATPGGTVIFLVRPDGIRAFNLALAKAEAQQVRNGKLPIPGQGALDLTAVWRPAGDANSP